LCLLACSAISQPMQSVYDFQENYSGETCFNAEYGVLTIKTSGYLKFPNALAYYYVWQVDTLVKEIIIKKNTVVNAAFHYQHGLMIRGLDRNTSIIYGTTIEDWENNNGGNPVNIWYFSAIWKKGGTAHTEIRDLTFLNLKAYAIRGFESVGRVDVYNCNFVDDRGGWLNHSDGISTSANSTIKNCYFELGDDNIKVYFPNMTVEDCTFNMVFHALPFQLGWGNYTDGASMNASNIYIYGDNGRWGGQNYAIIGGGWTGTYQSSTVTINIDGLYAVHDSASLVNYDSPKQYLQGSITNANLNIERYWGALTDVSTYSNNTMTLCGQQPGTLASCSNTQWSGSTVDSYTVPQFALNFINSDVGNHATGTIYTVADVNNPPPPTCTGSCPYEIYITLSQVTNKTYSAVHKITTNSVLQNNSTINYFAGDEIEFEQDFDVLPGSYFDARLKQCGGLIPVKQ